MLLSSGFVGSCLILCGCILSFLSAKLKDEILTFFGIFVIGLGAGILISTTTNSVQQEYSKVTVSFNISDSEEVVIGKSDLTRLVNRLLEKKSILIK